MSVLTEINYNGLVINESSGYTITRLEGFDTLPIRTSKDNLTANHGGLIWNQKYGMRTIAIEGNIWGQSESDYFTKKKALVKAFSIIDDRWGKNLFFTDWTGGFRYMASARVVEAPIIVEKNFEQAYAHFRVQLMAEDPFLYGMGSAYMLTQATPSGFPIQSGGIPILTGGGVPLLNQNNANEILYTNAGDVESFPVYSFYGPVINPSVTNVTTGASFSLNLTVNQGERIDAFVDIRGTEIYRRLATDQQVSGGGSSWDFTLYNSSPYLENVYYSLQGDLPTCIPGQNLFRFGGTPINSDTFFCLITLRPRYLSV